MKFDPSDWVNFFPKQRTAFRYMGRGYRLMYGGARGGGKSRFALDTAWLACCQYPGLRMVIVRETFNELENNFISKFQDQFPERYGGKRLFRYRQKEKTATFWNGARLIFRSCESEQAARKLQGIEFQLLILDEGNNLPERVILRLGGKSSPRRMALPLCLGLRRRRL